MKVLTPMLCVVLSISACTKSHQVNKSLAYTLVFDQTDPLLTTPDSASIHQVFDFEHYPDRAVTFRVVVITDKKLNESYTAYIPSEEEGQQGNVLDDVNFRNNAIRTFLQRANAVVALVVDTTRRQASQHSECLSTIAEEVNRLGMSTASTRVLHCYSNLFENSDISVYTSDALDPPKASAVQTRLHELNTTMGQLEGVELWFIYKPVNRNEDRVYAALSNMYTRAFLSHRARVFTTASNPSNFK
jgi:hypothetical protein